MKSVPGLIIGLLACGIAAYMLLSIWLPQIRVRWKGTHASIGAMAGLGITIFVGGIGAMIVYASLQQARLPRALGFLASIVIMVGWCVMAVGRMVDEGAFRGNRKARDTGLIFVAFGILFIGVMLYGWLFSGG